MDFEFFNVPRIVFGRGRFARLGEVVAPMGSTALIVHNVNEALVARTKDVLAKSNVGSEFVRQHGEPTVDHVDAALNLAKERRCDVVVGYCTENQGKVCSTEVSSCNFPRSTNCRMAMAVGILVIDHQ